MKKLRVALIYNAYTDSSSDSLTDTGSAWYLRQMIRHMARTLRRLGHETTVIPLDDDLSVLQRKLIRLQPDLVFNQYDDVVPGALYEMRVAAFIKIMGFPITGSPAIGLGLSRNKFMTASLLQGAGIPVPPGTTLLERLSDINHRKWRFPLIVRPGREHAGIGLDRRSVVHSRKALDRKARQIIRAYKQPSFVQHFLRGREFNVGFIGGRKLRILPLAEVDYSRLPKSIPPIMSYAAKWIETSVEYKKTSVICPAEVEPGIASKIADTAIKAFRAIGGWGYGRVDIRLDKDSAPHVLDVNCNPCLDEGMGLARSAETAGISYSELLQLIIKVAFEGPPYDVKLPLFNFPEKPGKKGGKRSGRKKGQPVRRPV